jgi:hypothetical protein
LCDRLLLVIVLIFGKGFLGSLQRFFGEEDIVLECARADGGGFVVHVIIRSDLFLLLQFGLFEGADFTLGLEKHLAEVAGDSGFAGGEATFDERQEDFGEEFPDLIGRGEVSRDLGEFSGESCSVLPGVFVVGAAEAGLFDGQHSAA